MYKKKVLQDPGPNTHTAATIRKEVLFEVISLRGAFSTCEILHPCIHSIQIPYMMVVGT